MLAAGITELSSRVHLIDVLIRWRRIQISSTPGKAANIRKALHWHEGVPARLLWTVSEKGSEINQIPYFTKHRLLIAVEFS